MFAEIKTMISNSALDQDRKSRAQLSEIKHSQAQLRMEIKADVKSQISDARNQIKSQVDEEVGKAVAAKALSGDVAMDGSDLSKEVAALKRTQRMYREACQ